MDYSKHPYKKMMRAIAVHSTKDYSGGLTMDFSNHPYKELAHAIVAQAVKDYMSDFIGDREFKRFVYGAWFMMLTNIDGDYLFKKAKELKDDRKRAKERN